MAFRSHSLPFQFASSDPVERQAELQKRFGLTTAKSDKDKMLLDISNPNNMGTWNRYPGKNSPLLQRREPVKDKEMPNGTQDFNTGRKPTVRVVPIEIEGADTGYKRARNFFEPDSATKKVITHSDLHPNLSSSSVNIPVQVESLPKKQPKVCDIPIKIEDRSKPSYKTKKPTVKRDDPPTPKKQDSPKKQANETTVNGHVEPTDRCDTGVPLKQINTVLEKLSKYQEEVEQFSGSTKDKQYKYLDEMLVRCMLDLDNVETMGKDDIRQARKAAVKKVQSCIDLLESKAVSKDKPVNDVNPVETAPCSIPNGEITSLVENYESTSESDIENNDEVEMTSVTEEDVADKVSDIAIQHPDPTLPSNNQEVEMTSASTSQDDVLVKDIEMTSDVTPELGLDQSSSPTLDPQENVKEIEMTPVTEETSANQETNESMLTSRVAEIVNAEESNDPKVELFSGLSCELNVEPNSVISSEQTNISNVEDNATTQEVEMMSVPETVSVNYSEKLDSIP